MDRIMFRGLFLRSGGGGGGAAAAAAGECGEATPRYWWGRDRDTCNLCFPVIKPQQQTAAVAAAAAEAFDLSFYQYE